MAINVTMHVLKQNMDEANQIMVDLSYLIHEYVTDCWSQERAEGVKVKILDKQCLLEQRLGLARELVAGLKV